MMSKMVMPILCSTSFSISRCTKVMVGVGIRQMVCTQQLRNTKRFYSSIRFILGQTLLPQCFCSSSNSAFLSQVLIFIAKKRYWYHLGVAISSARCCFQSGIYTT